MSETCKLDTFTRSLVERGIVKHDCSPAGCGAGTLTGYMAERKAMTVVENRARYERGLGNYLRQFAATEEDG